MPGSVINFVCTFSWLTATLQRKHYYYLCFTNGENEAQRCCIISQDDTIIKKPTKEVGYRLSIFRVCALNT